REHQMLQQAIVYRLQRRQMPDEVARLNMGEEPEPSHVDADDRNLPLAHLMRGLQDRAVATQHDRQIGVELRQIAFEREVFRDQIQALLDVRTQLFRGGEDMRPSTGAQQNRTRTVFHRRISSGRRGEDETARTEGAPYGSASLA